MAEKKRLLALFIGIDDYLHIKNLNGCKADIQKVEQFFEEASKANEWAFDSLSLLDEKATREGILKGWEEQLIKKAGPEDVALIYFSGHGAQEEAGERFVREESDGKLEGWVCHDTGLKPGQQPLVADKEIRFLLQKLTQTGAEILYVSDSCHAGDNHRSAQQKDLILPVRRTGIVMKERAYEDFVFAKEIAEQELREKGLSQVIPQGRFVAIAACDSWEYAYENPNGGIFTDYFLRTLKEKGGRISYYDLVSQVRMRIRGDLQDKGVSQIPRVAASPDFMEDVFGEFLGGAARQKPLTVNLLFDTPEKEWIIDKGSVHGISISKEEDEKSILMIPLPEDKIAYGYIKEVEPGKSKVNFRKTEPGGKWLDAQQTYTAYLGNLLSAPLYVYIDGLADGVKAVMSVYEKHEAALQKANIYLSKGEEKADYVIRAIQHHSTQKNYLILTNSGDERPRVIQEIGWGEETIETVFGYLKTVVRFNFAETLTNAGAGLGRRPVEVIAVQDEQEVRAKQNVLTLSYNREKNGKPMGRVAFQLKNTIDVDLYVACLYMGSDFSIFPGFLQPAVQKVSPRQLIWAREGKEIMLKYDTHLQMFNWPEDKFYLKVIVSTEPFAADIYSQGGIPLPVFPWPERGGGTKGLLMEDDEEDVYGTIPDWQATLFTVKTPNPNFRPG